jgi:signal peptidase I
MAIAVWVVAAQRQQVERSGAARLWGYFAIWLLPILISLVLAMALRFAVIQPFRIPSGSMQPTLQVGDYILVKKWSYGYSRFSAAPFHSVLPEGRMFARQPQRGDIAVYRPTPEPDRDFVSRIVGLPGDRLQVIDGVLHINGAAVTREDLGVVEFTNDYGEREALQAWRESLPNGVSYTTFDRNADGELDNTNVYTVPERHYFMMGDDRDNAADSRVPSVVGYVPFDNLVGRVEHIIRSGPGRRGGEERGR